MTSAPRLIIPIAVLILSIVVTNASAQSSLEERMRQIEANNSAIAARIASIETKVDAIGAKLDAHMSSMKSPSGTLGPVNVPVNIPAGNYWLTGPTTTSQSTIPTGQWQCGSDGRCRWVPATGTASGAYGGYEWQWVNGQAVMVPINWGSSYYSYGYSSCGPAGCGIATYGMYGGDSGGSGSSRCGLFKRLFGRCR